MRTNSRRYARERSDEYATSKTCPLNHFRRSSPGEYQKCPLVVKLPRLGAVFQGGRCLGRPIFWNTKRFLDRITRFLSRKKVFFRRPKQIIRLWPWMGNLGMRAIQTDQWELRNYLARRGYGQFVATLLSYRHSFFFSFWSFAYPSCSTP